MKAGNYRLYDAFGELLYVLAMADGEVQQEEISTLSTLLNKHEWTREVVWSFDYESKKKNTIENTYMNVFYACVDIGPNPEYALMLEVLEKVAESSLGVVEEERKVIERFKADLLREFGK